MVTLLIIILAKLASEQVTDKQLKEQLLNFSSQIEKLSEKLPELERAALDDPKKIPELEKLVQSIKVHFFTPKYPLP